MSRQRGSSRLQEKLKTGSKVWVNMDNANLKHVELLRDMDLVDATGAVLEGIMMQGTIQSKSINTYDIYLDAAVESFHFSHEKTVKVSNVRAPPDHYVVVKDKVVKVRGLKFSCDNRPASYHRKQQDAVAELKAIQSQKKTTTTVEVSDVTAAAATTAAGVSDAVSATTTTVEATDPASVATTAVGSTGAAASTTTMNVGTSGTASTSATTTDADTAFDDAVSAIAATAVLATTPQSQARSRRRRGRGRGRRGGRRARAKRKREEEAEEEEDSTPELVPAEESSESESDEEELSGEDNGGLSGDDLPQDNADAGAIDLTNDFLTDDEQEVASDHEDDYIEWDQPKTWAKDKLEHPIFEQLGAARWRLPADRGSCATQDSGPHQDPRFLVKVEERNFLKLFLDALPIVTFWQHIVVANSKQRARNKTRSVVMHVVVMHARM